MIGLWESADDMQITAMYISLPPTTIQSAVRQTNVNLSTVSTLSTTALVASGQEVHRVMKLSCTVQRFADDRRKIAQKRRDVSVWLFPAESQKARCNFVTVYAHAK